MNTFEDVVRPDTQTYELIFLRIEELLQIEGLFGTAAIAE